MSQLVAINQQIHDLLTECINEGLLDDQFMQLMQLQVGRAGSPIEMTARKEKIL